MRPVLAILALLVLLLAGCAGTPLSRPEPPSRVAAPEVTSEIRGAWERFNAIRAIAGLAPVPLDAQLCAGAAAHVAYLVRHRGTPVTAGIRAHEQDPALPGYSEAGAAAGHAGNIAWSGSPLEAVEAWLAAPYHRVPMLEHRLVRVGLAAAEGVTVLTFGITPRPLHADERPVAYPAPGQRDVPIAFVLEGEVPEPRPKRFPLRTGFPITLSLAGAVRVDEVRALLTDGRGRPIEHALSSPAAPATGFPQSSVFILPRRPLAAGSEVFAEVVARVDGVERSWRWSFRTADALALVSDTRLDLADGQWTRAEGVIARVSGISRGRWELLVRTAHGRLVTVRIPRAELAAPRIGASVAAEGLIVAGRIELDEAAQLELTSPVAPPLVE